MKNKTLLHRPWWLLLRPHTLTAAVMPVFIGTAMAIVDGKINVPLFIAMLAASVLIQSAVNMFNEYFDFKRGLDTMESIGIGGVIVRREIDERIVLRTAVVFFAVSLLLGIYICENAGWWIAAVGSVSMAVGYIYSAGPRPLAYTSFGELTAGIFMGPVIVLIAYYIQTRALGLSSVLMSIPISILVAAILLANNIRDADGDRKKGRKTIAILYGRSKATRFLEMLFVLTFAWTALLVVFKYASPYILISFASIPKAVKSIRIFRSETTPVRMMPAMKATSVLHSEYGILFSLGLLLGKILTSG